ncbi:Cytochrome P450 71A25 [Platanthera guangdongensis]|uniref:Cytochrome P450 71A25 n=1 Tax=Platanthera guangdongensis TaxID=2320717 RepID=A0ABR2LHX8_9ASPA
MFIGGGGAVIIFLLISVTIFRGRGRRKPRTTELPPSPPAIPIFGNMHQIGRLFHRSLAELSKKYGPIFLIHLGVVPAVIISSAKIAEQVLKNHDRSFATRPSSAIIHYLSYGSRDLAFAPYGEYWRQVRRICVLHLLSAKRVESFRQVREEEVALLVAEIRAAAPSPVNLSEKMISLTNCIISRVALGKKYCSQEEKGFGEMLKQLGGLLQSFTMKDCVPWLAFWDQLGGLNARVNSCFKKFDGFLEQVVEDHAVDLNRRRSRGTHDASSSSSAVDFVDILLSVKDESEDGGEEFVLNRGSIKAIINDMFIAGTDTLYNTLEWSMAELISHPTSLKKAQDEIREAVGSKPNITEEETAQMHYLKAAVKETLRLHPPFPMLVPREAREDVKLHGYTIPAKTVVFINAWAIARDGEHWEKADEFWPERFLNNVDSRGQDFHYIPFGGGRRGCPGISFSFATIVCALANLLCFFDWEIEEERKEKVLDMREFMDINVHKKFPLLLIAKPYIRA